MKLATDTQQQTADLTESLICLADDALILGHRLSQWCGHAPILEEDLSLPNIGLDLLGQARNLYSYAAQLEDKGRDEDAIAYLRNEREYHHVTLVERLNTDFAFTMLRQLYFAAFMVPYWQAACSSSDNTIAGIASKAIKEHRYHLRHAGEWVIRLGDGTDESHQRMLVAVAALHPDTAELFVATDAQRHCAESGLLPDIEQLYEPWQQTINTVFHEATLVSSNVNLSSQQTMKSSEDTSKHIDHSDNRKNPLQTQAVEPVTEPMPEFLPTHLQEHRPERLQGHLQKRQHGRLQGRIGIHTEQLGHLLSELQYLQRSYPGQTW